MRLIIVWLINAAAVYAAATFVPGIHLRGGFISALFVALVLGLVNATIGWLLKLISFPITIVTFGLFLIVINALMLYLVAGLLKALDIDNFIAALIGAVVISLVAYLLDVVIPG